MSRTGLFDSHAHMDSDYFTDDRDALLTQLQEELDGIIKRLYEDNITGKLSDERFKIFSTDYEDEQHSLREEVASLKQQLEDMESTSVNVRLFESCTALYRLRRVDAQYAARPD